MTNEIDWDNAPEGAEFCACGQFYRHINGVLSFYDGSWIESAYGLSEHQSRPDYQERPQPKPKYIYGIEYPTNGQKPDLPDDVLVEFKDVEGRWDLGEYEVRVWAWDESSAFRIVDERYKPAEATVKHKHLTTATDYLSECAQVQSERAKQYDASGTGERSFEAAAEAFNCVTGKNLRGSDVCLILEMVKLVRQYSDPTRLHEDSVLDKVSYSALWAEELAKELR